MLRQWNQRSRPGLGRRMTNHTQGGVKASRGDESSPPKMIGLRPTDETRGSQALSATSSSLIPRDTTITLPTQATQGAARTGPHKQNMPKQAATWGTKKRRGTKEGEKKLHAKINPKKTQVKRTKKNNKSN